MLLGLLGVVLEYLGDLLSSYGVLEPFWGHVGAILGGEKPWENTCFGLLGGILEISFGSGGILRQLCLTLCLLELSNG